MRFYQNTVPLQGDKTPSLEEFAAKVLGKTQESEPVVKTASAEDQVKTAEKDKEEADSSGQPEWEGKQENVNEPEDKSEEKDCYAEGEAKVEKEAKWNFEKGDDDDKSDDDDKDAKCAEGESKVEKTAEEKEECESSGQLEVEPLHQKGESEEASKVNDGNKKEAEVSSRLVKISKLDSKTKNMLVEYYKMYYPADYVDALVKEK